MLLISQFNCVSSKIKKIRQNKKSVIEKCVKKDIPVPGEEVADIERVRTYTTIFVDCPECKSSGQREESM